MKWTAYKDCASKWTKIKRINLKLFRRVLLNQTKQCWADCEWLLETWISHNAYSNYQKSSNKQTNKDAFLLFLVWKPAKPRTRIGFHSPLGSISPNERGQEAQLNAMEFTPSSRVSVCATTFKRYCPSGSAESAFLAAAIRVQNDHPNQTEQKQLLLHLLGIQ